MALDVSMTGSGTIGDITPGWSVNESATPVAIGDISAGTGTVSFTARATDDSLLCINNDVVSTVNGFGTVNGVVQSVNESGPTASITHGTLLDKFNLDISMPPLLGGDVATPIDYFEQSVLGNPRTNKVFSTAASRQFYTMTGHGYCFLEGGDGRALYQAPSVAQESISYISTGDEEYTYNYLDIRNQVSAENFARISDAIYASNVTGNMFYSESVGGSDETSTFTVTIGSSATVTYTGGFAGDNAKVYMSTTGALPGISGSLTGITAERRGSASMWYWWYVYNGTETIKVGDTVVVSGFTGSGATYMNGTKTVTAVDGNSFYCGFSSGSLFFVGGVASATVTGSARSAVYAINTTSTTFKMALQPDGAALTTTGTQSGTHTLVVADSANRSSRIYYKTMLNGGDNTFNIVGALYNLDFDWSLDASLFIDYSAETISFVGTYGLGGVDEPMTATASIASLNLDAELAVFLQYFVEPESNYKLRATICNTSDYETYVTVEQELSNQATPIIKDWTITGYARDIFLEINSTSSPSLTTEEYALPSTFYVDESTRALTAPVISYAGVFWEYLQMACAAFSQEIAVDGNQVTIRDVGGRVFDITNVVASPTINPTSTLSGKQINIPYTGSSFVDGVVYDAQADGNNVITVEAGETTVVSVRHNVHPITVEQPYRYLATGTGSGATFSGPLPDGSYFVVDSTDLPISENQWEDYGGSLSVEIDHEDPSAIQVTVVGPYAEIPSTTGPYRIAVSDGEEEYGGLKIKGTGVYSADTVLELLTGIDPDKYTRATVNTINNPFIATEELAYDRGVWAAQKASGPVVTMSATVPSNSIAGIGLTCGSLVQYRNSTYRITSCSIGSASSTINAERYVTVADMDAIWGAGITAPRTFTMTIASPAVITLSSHGLSNGDFVSFSTTGTLPTDAATSETIWGGYVINAATNTFQISATQGGSAINSTGSQSGTHSLITGDTSVTQYDSLWGSYECQDQIIFPYMEA